jgi:phosphatidylglycerophosphatase A
MLTAFLLFRLFDIWKPYPIRQLDRRFKNGLGVMLDDLLAAVYAMLSVQLLMQISHVNA